MYTDRKLVCKSCGDTCTGDVKKVHSFRWVKF